MFGRTPYRKLAMPQQFTPSRKKPKIVVDDSAESLRSVSANENSEEDESGIDDDVALFTPKRIYQTDWKVVEKWSTSMSLSEIDRQIDAILARCLRSAGYVAEHVAKTKDTDRSYWKEAHVSSLFNVAIVIALLMRILLCAGYSQRQMFQEIYRFVPMSP
jgi:DNA-directed RNA polymerase specialized sigma54-like protein